MDKILNDRLYECHGHLMMDGADFFRAKRRHESGVDTEKVKEELGKLKDAGVVYFRDGGDALGVSVYAGSIAAKYGITCVTPIFAIHKKGYYGGIVGHAYSDLTEFRALVKKVREEGGDFIKIMISGIITFNGYGELSCPSLSEEEIRSLVKTAHDAGFPVMLHVNGDPAIRAALKAGADSIEHGAFMSEETARLLAESPAVWVPTAAAIAAFTVREGIDPDIAKKTLEHHLACIRLAAKEGAFIAAGSDSGAAGVLHGSGTKEEYRLLSQAGVSQEILAKGNERIAAVFHKRSAGKG